MTRQEVQDKIDLLRGAGSIKLEVLTPLISTWLNGYTLGYEGMSQEFIKQKILEDLQTYEGVTS